MRDIVLFLTILATLIIGASTVTSTTAKDEDDIEKPHVKIPGS